MDDRRRVRIRVTGVVQGVGFRPTMHRAATAAGLTGFVVNDPEGVVIEVEGALEAVAAFAAHTEQIAPPLARVDHVSVEDVEPRRDGTSFEIRGSRGDGQARALVPADVAPCDDCIRELHDPDDRRHGYPFLNCTNCGPRLTIIDSVPYDRGRTAMASFEMCDDCRREYDDPSDRRFHAQPTCCPRCGPLLRLLDADGTVTASGPDVIEAAVALLAEGQVVAVKGVGGYHLAVDASDEGAVARLRARKHREERPFAVLCADLDAVRRLCEVSAAEASLLAGIERPIVLLRSLGESPVAPAVAPSNDHLGVMLPPSPLHLLLAERMGGPVVLTSGNRSGEPMVFRDDDVVDRLTGIADAFVTHDRSIRTRVDDSVARVMANRPVLLRRSRGYAPRPIRLPRSVALPVLACGAQLKNTVCIARDTAAFVSQHIGDLDEVAAHEAFHDTVTRIEELFGIRPEVVAHDLHPDFASTSFALSSGIEQVVGVQHHHAHIASCLVDNAATEPVIGVAFDGFGLGTDGTAWGGEFLVADLAHFERVGHLRPVPLPGGDAAVREPWRMAVSHLTAADPGSDHAELDVARRHADAWPSVASLVTTGIHAPPTSSAGRLFDAVAAILGVRDACSYEGQAAIELEQLASCDAAETSGEERYEPDFDDCESGPFVVDTGPIVRAVVADLLSGHPPAAIAHRFHQAVVTMIRRGCAAARDEHGLDTVALSGGVFQNRLLVESVVPALERDGFTVLTHAQIPPNDGGISLGQAAVAASHLR